ncbi:hypothetical protein [Sandaracinus amylolyticus]|uniref:Uncharacterized protein n=1 Tax=Sandaracinus amylolyticus TaxID=927083 RepID=A0A0F6SDI1_9BACT|nr:hypothetical protein [Sandaracinus amylolyticus]AKF03484.1 hypothetical protein DB32_000633 [Sandaracinus amylolyticus]
MAVRVPSQASTKWWILLAAVLAALLTYWQHRDAIERAPSRPPAPQSDFVEVEIVAE